MRYILDREYKYLQFDYVYFTYKGIPVVIADRYVNIQDQLLYELIKDDANYLYTVDEMNKAFNNYLFDGLAGIKLVFLTHDNHLVELDIHDYDVRLDIRHGVESIELEIELTDLNS